MKHGHLEANFEKLASEKQKLHSHHASLEERVKFLESTLGDSADKHRRAMEEAHSRFRESAEKQQESAEKQSRELEAKLHAAHSRLDQLHSHMSQGQQHMSSLAQATPTHTSVEERLGRLERSISSGSAALAAAGSSTSAAVELQMSQVKDRIQYLESLIGDSADKHRRELEAAHAKIREHSERHSQELEATDQKLQQAHGRLDQLHSHVLQSHQSVADHHVAASQTLEQRLERVEQTQGTTEAQMSSNLEGQLSSLKARIQSIEGAVMASTSTDKDSKSILQNHHATLKERVDYMEHLLGASADKHDKHATGLEGLRTRLEHTLDRIVGLERHAKEVEDYHRSCAVFTPEEKAALDSHLKILGTNHDKTSKDLQAIKSAHYKHTNELEAMRSDHQTTAQEAAAAHAKLEHLHGRLSGCEARERPVRGAAIIMGSFGAVSPQLPECPPRPRQEVGKKSLDGHSILKGHKEELAAKHASMAERLDYLEHLMGDSADRHARELEAVKAAHSKHAKDLQGAKAALAHQASMAERVDLLESTVRDSGERHAKATSSALARLDAVQRRLVAVEAHGASGSGGAAAPTVAAPMPGPAQEASMTSLRQRMDQLEAAISDHAFAHGAQLEDLKASHSRMSNQAKAHSDKLSSIALQDRLGGSSPLHAALGSTASGAWSMVAEAAHAKAEAAHAKVEQHATELQLLKDKQAKHEKDTKAAQATHQTSVSEKMGTMEKIVHDTASKHAGELTAASTRADQLHTRLSQCETQHAAVSELRRSHSALANQKAALHEGQAVLKDRLDALDIAHGAHAEKHANELTSVKASQRKLATDAQSHQSKVNAQLAEHHGSQDTHHASVQERLAFFEKTIGDSADKHGKALEAHKASTAKLAEAHKAQQEHHASLEQRLEFLEVSLGTSADSPSAMLLARSPSSRLRSGGLSLGGLSLGSSALHFGGSGGGSATSSVVARVEFLEGLVGASADATHRDAKVTAHGPLVQRLDGLEREVGQLHHGQERIADGVESRLNSVKEAYRGW